VAEWLSNILERRRGKGGDLWGESNYETRMIQRKRENRPPLSGKKTVLKSATPYNHTVRQRKKEVSRKG